MWRDVSNCNSLCSCHKSASPATPPATTLLSHRSRPLPEVRKVQSIIDNFSQRISPNTLCEIYLHPIICKLQYPRSITGRPGDSPCKRIANLLSYFPKFKKIFQNYSATDMKKKNCFFEDVRSDKDIETKYEETWIQREKRKLHGLKGAFFVEVINTVAKINICREKTY